MRPALNSRPNGDAFLCRETCVIYVVARAISSTEAWGIQQLMSDAGGTPKTGEARAKTKMPGMVKRLQTRKTPGIIRIVGAKTDEVV